MRLTAQGRRRNHGPSEIFDFNIIDGRSSEESELVDLIVDRSPYPRAGGAVRSVTVRCFAPIRLGGDYDVRLKIDKDEIARLFYLTHKPEIEGLCSLFPQDKSNEEAP
jgi:hypothetical protein